MPKVSVYIRPTLNGKRQYVPANPANKNNQGVFYLRYEVNGSRFWKSAKTRIYTFALAAARTKEAELLLNPESELPVKPARPSNESPMAEAIEQYLRNAATKSGKTASGYAYTLGQFTKSCGEKAVTEITKQDLINFVGYPRATGAGDRTISNRVGEVVTFLRANGVKDVTLKHKYTEKTVRSYRPDELRALFAAATPDEWLLFQFFLCTGGREQEVQFAEWSSIDFTDKLFYIRETTLFTPKDREERTIPLPDFLVAALKQRLLNSTGTLIFPTAAGKPNGHMLRTLKTLAQRAGIVGSIGLHVFRKTYATLQHKAGVDARTIQRRLGHSDLSTTLAYLEGEDARSDRSREQVNGTFGTFSTVSQQPVQ